MWTGVSFFETLGWHGGRAETPLALLASQLLALLEQKLRSKLELRVSSRFNLGTRSSVGPTRAQTPVGLLDVCRPLFNGKAGEEKTEADGEEVCPLGNSCVRHMLLLV